MTDDYLKNEFEKFMDKSLVKELLFEFEKTKSSFWLGDTTKTLIHSARFCEICIAFLKQMSDSRVKININKINFGKYFEDLVKLSKGTAKEEMLYLVIPQVLKSVYTIRSKKRIAHIKMTNAETIDSEFVVTSCNWIMSQLIMLYTNLPFEEAITLTNSIMERKIPTIEQFEDGEMMILKKGLKFNEELLLVLYQFPKRMSRKELFSIIKPKQNSYISTYLNLLYKEKLIHLNKEGAIINKNGIKEIEENREKYFA